MEHNDDLEVVGIALTLSRINPFTKHAHEFLRSRAKPCTTDSCCRAVARNHQVRTGITLAVKRLNRSCTVHMLKVQQQIRTTATLHQVYNPLQFQSRRTLVKLPDSRTQFTIIPHIT
eukprot:1077823-Amphidinium_carterae.1